MARGYANQDWWHNYQIYRKKEVIFDNLPNRRDTPCFTYLPWSILRRGDRIHLEIWAPDNNSRHLEKEQVREFVKLLEKIRPFRIKIVEEGDRIFAIVWYETKFQTFSALTALRYAGEDNGNTHWPIVPFVLKYKDKAHILRLLNWGHPYIRTTKIYGNSGHTLLYLGYKGAINTSKELRKRIKSRANNLNDTWSVLQKPVNLWGSKFKMKKQLLTQFYEDIRS